MPPESTGVTFSNNLITSDTLTVLDFENIYNGGGVAIGDINNDGLQDIYFTANMVSSRLYLNKGNFHFEDVTEKAGVSTSIWANGVTLVDINQDGFKDIYICAGGSRNTPERKRKNLLFINNRNNTFTESAQSYGLTGIGNTVQAAFFDYDLDGDLDVYLLRNAFVEYSRNRARPKATKGESNTTDQLYRNNGDLTFTDISASAGISIEGFGLGVQVCDLNDDQWPDIFVSNDFITNDLLYLNNKDGTFTNRVGECMKHQTYNAMGNDIADFNNDGLVDLVEVDMLPEDNARWKVTIVGNTYDVFENNLKYGYEPQYIRNTLQLNNGNGTFSDIGYLAGVEATDWSWSPLFGDYNNDGFKDLFITNGYRQDITNLDFIKFSGRASQMGTTEGNRKERLDMLNTIPVGAVVAARQHRQRAGRAQPGQELRAGAGQLGEELPGVEAAVDQHQHVRVEQAQQAPRVVGFPGRRWPEHRAQQGAGAGLDQGHQSHHRVAGDPERGAQLAQPGPVAVGVGHLDRHAAVEGHRPVPAEPHARGRGLGHRPGQRLEQRLHRRGADPAAQIPQRLARHRHPQPDVEAGEHARPHLRRTHTRENGKGQNEIHPNPGRQRPQPPLGRAGLLKHRVDQLERHLPGQLTQMTGCEHPRRHGNRPDHRRHRRPQPGSRAAAAGSGPGGHDRIGHRGSFVETDLGRSRFYQEPHPFHRKLDSRVPRVTIDPTVTRLTTRHWG